jgi:hypothetical protein
MSVLGTLGRFFGGGLARMTPVTLEGFGAQTMKMKFARAYNSGGARAAGRFATARAANEPYSFEAIWTAQQKLFYNMIQTQHATPEGLRVMGISHNASTNLNGLRGMGIRDWFAGMNYRDKVIDSMRSGGMDLAMDTAGMRRRMLARAAVPALAGIGIASSQLLGSNNAISNLSGLGVGMGVHGAIGTGLAYKVGPAAGYGYLGLAGFNAIRSGNNFGPF